MLRRLSLLLRDIDETTKIHAPFVFASETDTLLSHVK